VAADGQTGRQKLLTEEETRGAQAKMASGKKLGWWKLLVLTGREMKGRDRWKSKEIGPRSRATDVAHSCCERLKKRSPGECVTSQRKLGLVCQGDGRSDRGTGDREKGRGVSMFNTERIAGTRS